LKKKSWKKNQFSVLRGVSKLEVVTFFFTMNAKIRKWARPDCALAECKKEKLSIFKILSSGLSKKSTLGSCRLSSSNFLVYNLRNLTHKWHCSHFFGRWMTKNRSPCRTKVQLFILPILRKKGRSSIVVWLRMGAFELF